MLAFMENKRSPPECVQSRCTAPAQRPRRFFAASSRFSRSSSPDGASPLRAASAERSAGAGAE
ncbi:hypothetical protein, partial [Paenibacillus mesophilus]|uniref:hypothetical protein n=1 Tax=Paenibacillus mesophilus TaxID=2582849 RepID=UPI001EE47B5D